MQVNDPSYNPPRSVSWPSTTLPPWLWYHAHLARDGNKHKVFSRPRCADGWGEIRNLAIGSSGDASLRGLSWNSHHSVSM